MSDFDRIREEGERISREEGYKVLLAEIAARDKEISSLREAIRRLAEQDATLSVIGGNVIVDCDAPLLLSNEEREAVAWAIYEGPLRSQAEGAEERAATLRKLLERTKEAA